MAVPQSLSPVTNSRSAPATSAVCPYLLASDGRWRSAAPAREHRCTALTPPTILAPDKQRRICLVSEHLACATFRAATGQAGLADPSVGLADTSETSAPVRGTRTTSRDIVRTAPLVLDTGRLPLALPGVLGGRGLGQAALLGLMAVAFAAIVLARSSSGDGGGLAPGVLTGAVTSSPSAGPSAEPSPTAAPSVEGTPDRTLVPSEVQPTAPPEAGPSVTPHVPTEPPPEQPTTYKVRRGDTLSGIAARFGTTVAVLAKLNDMEDPSRLKVGQVLDLP